MVDGGRLPKFNIAASKTGSENNGRRDSNGYPHIIDHARLHYVTANNALRCRLPKSKMAAVKHSSKPISTSASGNSFCTV
jgi:hypothetical protein